MNSIESSEFKKQISLSVYKKSDTRLIKLYPRIVFYILCVLAALSPSLFTLTSASAEEIKSRSAVVVDARTGRVLYAKKPELRLMPASTAKLMTALVVLENANLGDVVTVSKRAAKTAPTKADLKKGDNVTIEMLLYAALLKSANDAAVVLAEAVAGSVEGFVRLMNKKAVAIGAHDTRFINPHGLPGKGQYITAYDLSKIMRQAMKQQVLREILGTRVAKVSTETGRKMFIKNTNELLWSDDDLLGGKTGYTRQARHNFVSASERNGETIIVVLLGSPKRDLLWKETEYLMAFGFRAKNKNEKPVVYLSSSDHKSVKMTGISIAKKVKSGRYNKAKLKKTEKKPIDR
jgi:D-alanyl-D-alanine carboxypeptidase (penicillin-binding protein 5/6)